MLLSILFFFFFFNDTATTEIYTLSLHDALPIWHWWESTPPGADGYCGNYYYRGFHSAGQGPPDRKSTRLNSSHSQISYAVFCLKKKKKINKTYSTIKHYTSPLSLARAPVVTTII